MNDQMKEPLDSLPETDNALEAILLKMATAVKVIFVNEKKSDETMATRCIATG